jgi:hypothetical protein
MPRQNRVDPWGNLVAVAARGTMLGNRGVIHDASGAIRRQWKVKAWICCRLQFKGRHRQVMTPNRWTELFFLDEATALAAGHRPCFECRREDARRFKAAWLAGQQRNDDPPIGAVDDVLQAERLDRGWHARLDALPDGAMIEQDGSAWLWWRGRLRPWSFDGYGTPKPGRTTEVTVLTPPSIVAALARGYVPMVHASASGGPP